MSVGGWALSWGIYGLVAAVIVVLAAANSWIWGAVAVAAAALLPAFVLFVRRSR